MKSCLYLIALAALLTGCADVDDIDESRPATTYRGPISGPMSGPYSPISPGKPGALGVGDVGTEDPTAPAGAGR